MSMKAHCPYCEGKHEIDMVDDRLSLKEPCEELDKAMRSKLVGFSLGGIPRRLDETFEATFVRTDPQ